MADLMNLLPLFFCHENKGDSGKECATANVDPRHANPLDTMLLSTNFQFKLIDIYVYKKIDRERKIRGERKIDRGSVYGDFVTNEFS